jgi:hypothetical protein
MLPAKASADFGRYMDYLLRLQRQSMGHSRWAESGRTTMKYGYCLLVAATLLATSAEARHLGPRSGPEVVVVPSPYYGGEP